MHHALRMSAFFGVDAGEVLAKYRWIGRAEKELHSLDATLADLRATKTSLTEEYSTQISTGESKVAEVEGRLSGLHNRLEGLDRKRKKEARRIERYWHRLGIEIKRTFVKGAVGVTDTRRILEETQRDTERTEDEIDDTLQTLDSHRRSLLRLTDPIDDLDYALGYLHEQRDAIYQHSQSVNSEVDNLIWATAKDTLPAVLQRKLQLLSRSCDASGLRERVMELKSLATQVDLLRPVRRIKEMNADVEMSVRRIKGSVLEGIYTDAKQGGGEVSVSGNGTTHVRKTRSVSSTDSQGRSQSSTESYWAMVHVKFTGNVQASFQFGCTRWQKKVATDVLHDEMWKWIEVGKNHAKSGWFARLYDDLEKRALELVAEVREELERDLRTVLK